MATPEQPLHLETVKGPVSAVYARPRSPFATIVVAHGAGAGMEHPFLVGFTRACNDEGIATVRFNFPYIESGRRSPDTEAVAVETPGGRPSRPRRATEAEPVWASGKSLGGRIASMAAADGDPPGRPRLPRVSVAPARQAGAHPGRAPRSDRRPMLFLQGTSDPFATPALLQKVVERLGDRATLVAFEGGGHSSRCAARSAIRASRRLARRARRGVHPGRRA